jgi:hypothetical protein
VTYETIITQAEVRPTAFFARTQKKDIIPPIKILIDTITPVIEKFDFAPADQSGGASGTAVVATSSEYGYYFSTDTAITVTATDTAITGQVATGLASIEYVAVDTAGYEVVSGSGLDDDRSVRFVVPADFKGRIYARATDKVGNNPATPGIDFPNNYNMNLIDRAPSSLYPGYAHPSGAIFESPAMHLSASDISFDAGAVDGTAVVSSPYVYRGSAPQRDKTPDYAPGQNLPLYRSSPTFDINVESSFAGIKQVRWTAITDGQVTSNGAITVDESRVLTGDTAGWSAVRQGSTNLVQSLKNTGMTVSGAGMNTVLLVELTDRVGHASYDYYAFGVDTAAPGIDAARTHVDSRGTITGSAFDQDSGIARVVCGTASEYNNYDYVAGITPGALATFTPADASRTSGSYTFTLGNFTTDAAIYVWSVDMAGNKTTDAAVVYVDTLSPVIEAFDFAPLNVSSSHPTPNAPVTSTDYGFYFKVAATVTVSAIDDAGINPAVSSASGVAFITYLAEDVAGGHISGTEPADENGAISFVIPANFKGQIYAYATDKAGNTPMRTGINFPADYDTTLLIRTGAYAGYVHPGGAIVEDETKHREVSSIEFTVPTRSGIESGTYPYPWPAPEGAQQDSIADYNTSRNVPLFKYVPTFGLRIESGYAGIYSVKWTVFKENGILTSQTVTVAADGTLAGDADGWAATLQGSSNLVESLTKQDITIEENSNDMLLLVELTDRAGNASYDFYAFGIDTAAPTVAVRYDNNDADSGKYFKADRTATIIVTERNFDPDAVRTMITNTDETIPELSDWRMTNPGTGNGDDITHTATVRFATDGDYTFDISLKDRANNASVDVDYGDSAVPTDFTVDKTLPVVTVGYDNINARNDNYFAQPRTATITVDEHNFNPDRVRITGTATDNGTDAGFPSISGWTNAGDTHTTTIFYGADAFYSFGIEAADLAGNVSAEYAPDEFFIDRTAPTLQITNVEDLSANNDEVIPIISFSDTNYDADGVNVTLTGTNRGSVAPQGTYTDSANGQTFTFADFERVKEQDDLYTLAASVTDKAGNTFENSIRFSVNRFGSVYVLHDSLHAVKGTYLRSEQNIIFREINVDLLKEHTINIRVSKDGATRRLSNGDYSYETLNDPGTWTIMEYTVPKTHFENDGNYSVVVYSEDAAGNINENIAEEKEAEIDFAIDKTAPVIVVSGLSSGESYGDNGKTVQASIRDNLKLNDVRIQINGEDADYDVDGEMYSYTIASSSNKQSTHIVAADAAGNETVFDASDFLVTSNAAVRWFYNTPLFVGSLIGIAAVAFAIWLLWARRRKSRQDEETTDGSVI